MTVPAQIPTSLPVRLAFVGEAPSVEEVLRRKPLVGPAGSVFNAMLRSANIDREELHITNLFDEKAPDNDVIKAGWLKDEVRVAEAFARLNEEFAITDPTVIVPMGNSAMWAFNGESTNISKWRGAVSKATRLQAGHKIIPTYHPSYVQRNWSALTTVVGDFIKAAREADRGPDIYYPHVQLFIDPTLEDIREWKAEWLSSPKLSVDIETGWGQITSIQFAPSETRSMTIPFVDLREPNKNYWKTAEEEVEVWKIVLEVLASPVAKVGQNFAYDFYWLWKRRRGRVMNYRSDTRLRHKVLFPELPADLASMGATYTDLGAWKMWGGRYQKEVSEKKDG